MGTMTLAMLFVYNPTVLRKRFGAIDLHSKERERVFICQKHKIQYCRTIPDNVGGLPKKQTLINAGRP